MVQSAPDPDAARKPRRLSDILQEIADAPAKPDERISLGHRIEGFGNRAFGALLFIFAVPVALPIAIPGISAVLGAPLLFLSWQLMHGRDQPWLPEVMRSRSFRRADFAGILLRVLPSIRGVERLVGPRLIWLTNRRGEQVIGLFAFALAVVLFLPIPFGNTVPALAIAIMALAVLERDGVAAIAGTLVGLAGIALVSGVVVGLVKGAIFIVQSASRKRQYRESGFVLVRAADLRPTKMLHDARCTNGGFSETMLWRWLTPRRPVRTFRYGAVPPHRYPLPSATASAPAISRTWYLTLPHYFVCSSEDISRAGCGPCCRLGLLPPPKFSELVLGCQQLTVQSKSPKIRVRER